MIRYHIKCGSHAESVILWNILAWCKDTFGASSTDAKEAKEQNHWSYTWTGLNARKQWLFDIANPEFQTMFAMRWGNAVVRAESL